MTLKNIESAKTQQLEFQKWCLLLSVITRACGRKEA